MKKLLPPLFVLSILFSSAQDGQFSQYYAASLYLNPAFNGIYNNPSIHMNAKRQLQSVDVVNELTQVSLILPIKPQGKLERSIGGAGLMVYSEKSGPQGIQQINGAFLNYAHNLKFGVLSAYVVSFGLQVGYEQRSLTFDNFKAGSQYNKFLSSGFDSSLPGIGPEFNEQSGSPIVNFGAMYHYNPDRNYLLYKYNAFAGISVTNLNRPNTSATIGVEESIAPMLWKYNGGIEFKLNKLYVTPNLLALYQRGNYQFNAGFNMAYAPNSSLYSTQGVQILFGSYYRFRDSFIFMGGFSVANLTLRASYDLNTKVFVEDRLVPISNNSVELSIQYSLVKQSGIRKLSNPLF